MLFSAQIMEFIRTINVIALQNSQGKNVKYLYAKILVLSKEFAIQQKKNAFVN